MKSFLACSFILLFTFINISGQSNGEESPEKGDLSLRIKSLQFIDDNEYKNPIVEGYTLLGFFFQPELVYKPARNVSLRAGTHILNYYGAHTFSQFRPVFSTILNFSEKTSLTLGTLSGADRHQLSDPHFFRERLYNKYVEDGIQVTHTDDNFFNDTWISWENFIFKGDSTREQFTFGESFRYNSKPIAGFMSLEVPVQIQIKHFGGQITEYPENVESFLNVATGIRLNFDLAGKRLGQAGIEYLQFLNSSRKDDTIAGTNHGNASWLRFLYSYKALSIQTGYWKAKNFYAPNGNPIYGSVSDYQPGLAIHNRRIITNSVSLKFMAASSLEFYFGIDLYYDIDLRRIDQAYMLHLDFDKLINLISSKQKITNVRN